MLHIQHRCDHTPSWQKLNTQFEQADKALDLRTEFARDSQRLAQLSWQAPHVFADLSKNLISHDALKHLLAVAQECGLDAFRHSMASGEKINLTENRAVLHTALRAPPGGLHGDLVHGTLDRMMAYVDQVHAAKTITDVVNIGIGGSDLGPQMAVAALEHVAHAGIRSHFVSNVDAHDMASVLAKVKVDSVLFIIASKTFTTAETLTNAKIAKEWFEAQGGKNIDQHFVGVTTNVEAAQQFGISTTFGFWDWVGGRYSLWSAIGLPIALAIGSQGFRAFLRGAHEMDEHFWHTPAAHNVPLLMGLLDLWYRNFHAFSSRSVAPYHHGLRRLPAYLQQLEMESNGKGVDAHGNSLPFHTSPVIWGEPGTNGQHSFFQMLHQGTQVVPLEFILVKKPAHGYAGSHRTLLANGVAQAQALMVGKSTAEAAAEHVASANPELSKEVIAKHRSFSGNRPSTTLLLEELSPASLGALIALYEHRVFTSGALWGINSFDQWGVELGKALAKDIEARMVSHQLQGLDASTAGLLQRLA